MTNLKRPNILLIMPDDTDFVWLSCYGGRTPTPHIDRIASQGVRFDAMYCSASACTPSRYSYLTGHYAGRCPDSHFLSENPLDEPYKVAWNTVINENIHTISSVLRENGYRTGISGKWHVGCPRNELILPTFDPSDDPDDPEVDVKLRLYQQVLQEEVKRTGGFDFAASIIWGNNESFPVRRLREHNLEWTTQGAFDFLDTIDDSQPFFLYVTPTAFHGPPHDKSYKNDPLYTQGGKLVNQTSGHPPRSLMEQRLKDRNLSFNHDTVGITWIDDLVGVLVAKLEQMDLLQNTVVVFKVDHNTEPGKGTCHQHGIRIPFIMQWQGHITPGSVINANTLNTDLAPTIFDICGISAPHDMLLDGLSLLPLLNGEKSRIHNVLYFEFGYARAILVDKWKYIALRYPNRLISQMENGLLKETPNHINQRMQGQMNVAIECYPAYFDPEQLFNIEDDPHEQHNLVGNPAYTKIKNDLRDKLHDIVSTFEHPFDLKVPAFMLTERYQKLCDETRKIGTDYLYWWPKKQWW